MGWSLRPIKRTPDCPHDPQMGGTSWHYNVAGWELLNWYLRRWNVDTSEFSGYNDGERISKKTCVAVADALDAHFAELPPDHQRWLQGHAMWWRKCGGCRQY